MSRNQTSHVKSTILELLVITGMMAVTIALLLPVVQRVDRVGAAKGALRKVPHQSIVSHHSAIPVRSAKL